MIYYYYYCDKDVNIDIGEMKFEIKRTGLNFSLNSNDLFIEYNNNKFFLITFGIEVEKQNIKLGYPFLKKYDMIFDLDKRHIGFYNFKIKFEYKHKDENADKTDVNISDDINKGNKNENNLDNNDNKEKVNENKNINEMKSEKQNENNMTKKIIIILLLIFLIVLVLYLVFIIYRNCERKRKGKIFEEVFL